MISSSTVDSGSAPSSDHDRQSHDRPPGLTWLKGVTSHVWLVMIFALLLSIAIGFTEIQLSPLKVDEHIFSTVNVAVEILRIALCLGIFGVRWLTRKFGTDLRSLTVAMIFLSAGIMTIFRLLTFPDMPSAAGSTETISHSLYFSLFMRYTIGALMLASVFIPYDKPANERTSWMLLLVVLGYTAVVTVLVLSPFSPLPPAFDDFGGSYQTRMALELGNVVFLFWAAMGYAKLAVTQKERRFFIVAIGLVLIAQAGFTFVETDTYVDVVFLIGRSTSLLGFLMVFYALVMTSLVRPYDRLEKTTNEMLAVRAEVEKKTADLRALTQDLTERKLVEAALRESEKNMRQLIETATEGIWRTNADNVTTFANAQIAALLGTSPEDMIGRSIFDFIDPEMKTKMDSQLEGRRKGLTSHYDFELRRIDGTKIDVSISASPLTDELGEYIGSVAFVSDITQRKEAERILQRSEQMLFSLLDQLPVGVIVSDASGRYIFSNGKSKQLLGRGIDSRLPLGAMPEFYNSYVAGTDEQYPTERSVVLLALKGEASMVDDVEIRKPNETLRLEVWGAPVFGPDGKVIYAIAAFQDITQRKADEERIAVLNQDLEEQARKLAEMNKDLETFSYSVSHDLRAPLRSIDGFSNIIMEDYADKLDNRGKDYLRRVRAGCQRMGQLIDDMLKLSRAARDQMTWRTVDLSNICWGIIVDLRRAEPDRKIKVVIADGAVVKGDPHLYRILLTNLLGNAWKFTSKQPKPVIEFGVTAINDEKVYFVRDNGAGFDMAYADKLFVPFQRLHSSIDFAGTGIGLATAQRIIRRHGGSIWAESEVGKGTTIYFTEGRRGRPVETSNEAT
jgi:PAS domain S-box-containing protein